MDLLKRARRVGVPIVTYATSDPAASIHAISVALSDCVLIAWDIAGGLTAPPTQHAIEALEIIGMVADKMGADDPSECRNLPQVIAMMEQMPTATALVIHNAHWVQELPGLVEYHYPLLGDAGSVQKLEHEARTLGVIAAGRPTPWGTALFEGTTPSGLGEFLPAPAPGVFAHEDFTLLAPGPLMPKHRQILDRLTTKELGGLVPRYRVTPQAILDALQVGEPAETMSSLLQETSQNPLPEGILHLLEDTIRQSQNIRLRAVGKGQSSRSKLRRLPKSSLPTPR
jgi:hypothetical protein